MGHKQPVEPGKHCIYESNGFTRIWRYEEAAFIGGTLFESICLSIINVTTDIIVLRICFQAAAKFSKSIPSLLRVNKVAETMDE